METADIKISIIIPVYNGGEFLPRSIESVRRQTHKNLQIILIDDGSIDDSLTICRQFAERDSRIEVYHTENRGSVAARKYGLSLAEGEYIGFTDADDFIEEDMFHELLQKMIETNTDFVHSGYIEETEDHQKRVCDFSNAIIDLNDHSSKINFFKEYIFKNVNADFISPSIWSKLFKSELIKKCYNPLPDEQQYGEDLLCLYRCVFGSKRIALYKDAMYHYTVGENTLSHLKYDEYMKQEIGLWYHVLKLMEEYGCIQDLKDELYRSLKRRMLNVIWSDKKENLPIPRYYYKDITKIYGKRIVIFGAGNVGQDYYSQISKYKYCKIVAWIDSNWNKYHFSYAEVTRTENIVELSYDSILIAVMDPQMGMEIERHLIDLGIPDEKIEWQKPGMYF